MASYAEINNSVTLSLDEVARLLEQKGDLFAALVDGASFDVSNGDSARTLIFSSEAETTALKQLCKHVIPPIVITTP